MTIRGKKPIVTRTSMMKFLMYIYVVCVFFPADLIAINVRIFQLSLNRILLLLLLGLYLAKNNGAVKYSAEKSCCFSQQFMLCWFGYGVFTILWVTDIRNYCRYVLFLFTGVVLAMISVEIFNSKEDIRKVIGAMRIPITGQAMIGLYESFTGNHFFLKGEKNLEVYSRVNFIGFHTPVAMSSNVNDFVLQMFIGICVFYICWQTERNIILKIFDIIGISCCCALIAISGSRGGMLGVVLFFGFLAIYSKSFRNFLLIIGVVVLLFNGKMLVEAIISNLQTLSLSEMMSMKGDGSNSIRANLLVNGLIFLWHTLGVGVGMGQIECWMENKAIYYTRNIYNMHNWWCELLVSYGIIFFIIYLVFYGRLFLTQKKRIKMKDSDTVEISKGIAAFLIGFILVSISPSSCMGFEWLWMFWAIIIAWQGVNVQSSEVNRKI